MKKKLIEDALIDSVKIHTMISDTNNGVKKSSGTLKNVSLQLKIENKHIKDSSGVATGIAPLAQEIERVTKDMHQNVRELIDHHRERLYECNDILSFMAKSIIENENINITELVTMLTTLGINGQTTITSLELNDLALIVGKIDVDKISPNAKKYMK